MKVMIALIGEQPIPNLLPVRYDKPAQVVLVCTERTHQVAERLESLLGKNVEILKVTPYDIMAIQQTLYEHISQRGWTATDLIFNLTGGTKPMAFAAYCLAEQLGSPFLYLQSEGGKSIIYYYTYQERQITMSEREKVPPVLSLDDYLRAHLQSYTEEPPQQEFEKTVYDALQPVVDEIKTSVRHGGALEIDLVFRCGNQVGIAEVKSGKKAQSKEGIDQLNTAAEQRFLGTYTRKFLIVEGKMGSNNKALAEAHRIVVVELVSSATDQLSEKDRKELTGIVLEKLGG